MPEDIMVGPDLERLLEPLHGCTLTEENYKTIQEALEQSNGNIKVTVLEQLINICIHNIREDMKHPFLAQNVMIALLNKMKARSIHEVPDLVPSAIEILHIIKTTALFKKVVDVKLLCFEIILSYPDYVLVNLAVDHYIEIIEMLNLYCHEQIPMTISLQAINIVNKLLKLLPSDKRTAFVTKNVEIWFSKVVPTVMAFVLSTTAIKDIMPIETFEMLTEELISVDYSDNPSWLEVLECIYTPNKYPAIMQNLLESGNEAWYRLWICFTKLLKGQITKNMSSFGSPINSMLPVVEAAFKMNVKNRCRAFQCWNALIDNFSVEANEPHIHKRLKLLIIPLASNNAKVEETALAKLDTWWHLLRSFETKIKDFPNVVLLPFLYFCFGKPSIVEKPVSASGLLTISTKRQVLQAFANITGHINCDCTVKIPKLKNKILSSNLLIDHWKVWTNSLTMTVRICVNDNSDSVTQHFKCIWKSFIAAIAEMSDCNIRYNLFFELLKMLQVLLQCSRCDKLSELVFHIVTNSILDHNNKVQPVIQLGKEENKAIQSIISMLLNPSFDFVFSRYDTKEIVIMLKPLAEFIVQEYLKPVTEQYLRLPIDKNNSLLLWTALSEAICELQCGVSPDILHKMLLSPLKAMNLFISVDIFVAAWLKLYNYTSTDADEWRFDKDICEIITAHASNGYKIFNNKYFLFKISLTILSHRIQKNNDDETLTWKCAEALEYATNEITYSLIKNDLLVLQKTIISMLDKLTKENDKKLAKTLVLIINNVLKIISKHFEEIEKDVDLPNFITKLLEASELFFEQELYGTLKLIIVDELNKCKHCFNDTEKGVHNIINNMLGQNKKGTATVNSNILSEEIEKNSATNPVSPDTFTEPQVKSISKKKKKKDSNIIKTVVENEEEYVVVNSNWKFNPKKLTDNQKEKFRRTREDIPALYQDLSQSQDEFKTVYTTNSVDSTTSSKSNTAENNGESSIFKNMPCSNVVPTIIENIITESFKKDNRESTIQESTEAVSHGKQKLSNESSKRPRMAIKDRIFRNVKNLIEKSGLQKDDLNSTVNENLLLTPSRKQPVDKNLVNSAPPKINPERPTRMKRKPKKLDDHKLSPVKKRRNSLNQNSAPNIVDEQDEPENVESLENEEELDFSKLIHVSLGTKTQNEDDNNTNSQQSVCTEATNTIKSGQGDEISTNIKDATEEVPKTIEGEDKTTKNLKLSSSSTVENITTDTNPYDVNVSKTNTIQETFIDKEYSTPTKKAGRRASRIEKVLAIDMVEGHPFLKKQSATRSTRNITESKSSTIITRKSMEKLSNSKMCSTSTKSDNKNKSKDKTKSRNSNADKQNNSLEDFGTSQSQDIIESSQDSTLSIKSTKNLNKIPVVALENIIETPRLLKSLKLTHTKQSAFQSTQNNVEIVKNNSLAVQSNDDIEISRNKTVLEDKIDSNLTAEMDTEPAECDTSSIEVTEIRVDNPVLVVSIDSNNIHSENNTQETANADTQLQDTDLLLECTNLSNLPMESAVIDENCTINNTSAQNVDMISSQQEEDNTYCSPFKDDVQRKEDFINSTIEISPIKTLSPLREEQKSLSPETSNDFVVITLSSPVQSNGEPFNNSDSPEIFTNDKLSPDKRDQSPSRNETVVNNSSPSSSLSLKNNRPQVRSGRAAQMLVLCVPEGLPNIMNAEKSTEPEENKRSTPTNSTSRRNLRMLFNSNSEVNNDNEACENEESSSFLKLKRPIPTADSSPSGPILKRKLNDITDDTTLSPASKRKRVSFHDPPVSTTICVKKYIEPNGIRSPQNSMFKRLERQARVPTNAKSPKRLDTVFSNVLRLENALTKTVESFAETDKGDTNVDSEMSSLEPTPVSEVQTCVLNDTVPICAKLIDCKEPIANIGKELSLSAKKLLRLKECKGKVTISDLAKLTELEFNRLCSKFPKIHTVKKVLDEYANKIENSNDKLQQTKDKDCQEDQSTFSTLDEEEKGQNHKINVEVQTESNSLLASTQTESVATLSCDSQTAQSGEISTSHFMAAVSKKPDFINQLCEHLDENSKQEIAKQLPVTCVTEILMEKVDISNSYDILSTILDQHRKISSNEGDTQLSVIQDYLCNKFSTKDLIKLCSDILRNVSDKTT